MLRFIFPPRRRPPPPQIAASLLTTAADFTTSLKTPETPGSRKGKRPAILTMDEMGTPGEGTRPTSGRFCGRCRPGALTRRGVTGP